MVGPYICFQVAKTIDLPRENPELCHTFNKFASWNCEIFDWLPATRDIGSTKLVS